MALTNEQKEKILNLGGYKFDDIFWYTPQGDHLPLGEEPDVNSLDVLWKIIDAKITAENYYMEFKAGHGRYSVMIAPKFDKEVAVYSGITKTFTDALQQALLKLAEAGNENINSARI